MMDANEYYLRQHETEEVAKDMEGEEKRIKVADQVKELLNSQNDFEQIASDALLKGGASVELIRKKMIDCNYCELGLVFAALVNREIELEAERMVE
jgi:hypothetical protein